MYRGAKIRSRWQRSTKTKVKEHSNHIFPCQNIALEKSYVTYTWFFWVKHGKGIEARPQRPSDRSAGENIVTKSTRVDGNVHPGTVSIGFAMDPFKLLVTMYMSQSYAKHDQHLTKRISSENCLTDIFIIWDPKLTQANHVGFRLTDAEATPIEKYE